MKLLIALLFVATAQATTFTGTLSSPTGGLANGTLFLTPPLNVSLLASCGGPGAVGTGVIQLNVASGVVSGGVTGNDCMTPNNSTYTIRFVDSNGAIYTGRWYLFGNSIDVATLSVGSVYAGTFGFCSLNGGQICWMDTGGNWQAAGPAPGVGGASAL